MIEIPTLETERLILRSPKFEDLEPMEGFFSDPVRMKFFGRSYQKRRCLEGFAENSRTLADPRLRILAIED